MTQRDFITLGDATGLAARRTHAAGGDAGGRVYA
jgi:hypothetical protein